MLYYANLVIQGSTTLKMVVFDSDADSNGKVSLETVDVLTIEVVKITPDRGQADRQYTPMTMTGSRTQYPTRFVRSRAML